MHSGKKTHNIVRHSQLELSYALRHARRLPAVKLLPCVLTLEPSVPQEGEAPLLLVGLVDGQLVLVEVLRASVNLAVEVQTTILEHLLKGEQLGGMQGHAEGGPEELTHTCSPPT